jgi:hypothetical protein
MAEFRTGWGPVSVAWPTGSPLRLTLRPSPLDTQTQAGGAARGVQKKPPGAAMAEVAAALGRPGNESGRPYRPALMKGRTPPASRETYHPAGVGSG